MIRFKFENSGGAGRLIFYDDLQRDCVNELNEALMISVENAHHVIVDFKEVTRIDPLCLKAIYTAQRTALKLNKQLTFIGIDPEQISNSEESLTR